MAITRLNSTQEITEQQAKDSERFKNLVKQLPSEATGIYIAGLSSFADNMLWLTISAIIGLAILIWVRRRAGVTRTIWLTSIIGYFVWVYAIGNGPLQAAAVKVGLALPPLLGPFLAGVYGTIVTVLAINPPKGG